MSSNPELFEYTSGRFLFNEELRRAERRIQFDIDALASAACRSVDRRLSGVASITKLVEGGFNRVLQIAFEDGYAVLAKLPYKTTVPKRYAVASEAATLALLRAHGVPVPKVLTGQWFSMDTKTRVKLMRQIVDLESRLMSIHFPASGSLYHRHDLDKSHCVIPVSDDIVVGPTAQHEWWYQERAYLEIDRGPWNTFSACFEAPAKREIEFCGRFGKPRLHVERCLRELHQFHSQSPNTYQNVLANYLKLAPHLDVPSDHRMSRPTLRHPDFSPNNILVNSANDVVGIIDWQHAVVFPLCLCAEIHNHFQNWGDPLSETLHKPEVKLPEGFEELTNLFHHAQAPWEGDSVSLKYVLSQVLKNWPMSLGGGAPTTFVECPIQFSEEEIQKCSEDHYQEQEKLQELGEMRDLIGTDALGWVPDEAELERCRAIIRSIKDGLMAHSSTEMEKTAIISHFLFDDHEENT
ncbi:kinase-like protein [Aspergillus carlsbadensis]|nr:kinase-like protein [Aspergillus carlsbadensis]